MGDLLHLAREPVEVGTPEHRVEEHDALHGAACWHGPTVAALHFADRAIERLGLNRFAVIGHASLHLSPHIGVSCRS